MVTDETNKTADEEYHEALDFLKLDEEEVQKKSVASIVKNKDATAKLTGVNNIAFEYKMILEGKTLNENGDEYVQTGQAIAGDTFIRLSYGVLNSFSEASNLISNKDIEIFRMQFIDAFVKVNNFILRDRTIDEIHARMIIKLFKDKLWNIGDIITNNDGNMKAVFGGFDNFDRTLDGNFPTPYNTQPMQKDGRVKI